MVKYSEMARRCFDMPELKQQAVQMIENLQEDMMIQVVAYLKDIEVKSKKNEQKKQWKD